MKKLLSITNPELREEWHSDKNNHLSYDTASQLTMKKVWWRCKNNPPHEWQASIRSRAVEKHGCPFCSGRYVPFEKSIAALFPEIATEWHSSKNGDLRVDQIAPFTNNRAWWRCKDGHEWNSKINYRTTSRSTCPQCNLAAKSLIYTHPDLAAQWHPDKNLPLTPSEVTHGISKKVWWRCQNGHEWQSQIRTRVTGRSGCAQCARESNRNRTKTTLCRVDRFLLSYH